MQRKQIKCVKDVNRNKKDFVSFLSPAGEEEYCGGPAEAASVRNRASCQNV